MSTSFTSPNLKLPYIAPAQAQKHVTVNEALRKLDAVVQLSVLDKDLATPPPSPAQGDRYIIAANATGDWLGADLTIAAYQDGAWAHITPQTGWAAYVQDESTNYQFDGAAWVAITFGTLNNGDDVVFGTLGIGGATANATNILSFNGAAALFNNAGNGIQLKLNKNLTSDTASFLFQTGFSGRAEIGLAGDDDFHFKVSPDGASWANALVIDNSTGGITMAEGLNLQSRLHVTTPAGITTSIRIQRAATGIWDQGISSTNQFFIRDVFSSGNPIPFLIDQEAPSNTFIIKNTGYVGLGTPLPTTKLDVDGPIRCKSYTVAALPSASANGAGSMIYVTDETGGAVLAFSDGTNWLRVTDRAVVS